jgi:hypothetical protein
MTQVRTGWIALAITWAISLVFPHFQSSETVLGICLSFLLLMGFVFAFYAISSGFDKPNLRWEEIWFVIPIISYLAPISLLYLYQIEKPYYLWSKLTAGSMTLDGRVYPLGDLAQVTAAANCQVPIEVGKVVCDPWLRLLNQNTDVVNVFRILNLTNLPLVGIFFFFLFISVLAVSLKQNLTSRIPILLFVSSPSILLAIERGNELLTISLLVVGFQLLLGKNFQFRLLGILLLFMASAFKLWPTFVIYVLLVLFRSQISKFEKLLLSAPIFYWLSNSSEAFAMIKSTQAGSLFGNSFGFKLWISSESKISILIFLLLFLLTMSYVVFRNLKVVDFESFANINRSDSKILAAYSLNFFVIWLVGDSFAYRLVALVPIVIILSKRQYQDRKIGKILLVLTLTTVFTIRLSIAPVVTTCLALALLYVSVNLLKSPNIRNS